MLEVCFHDSVKGALRYGGYPHVAGISFGLSQGDIQSPICYGDCPRKACIRSMFSFVGNRAPEEAVVQAFWAGCMEDLKKLEAEGQAIRIWLDRTPDAQCGLLFAAGILRESRTEIRVVELPRRMIKEDGSVLEYHGWHEVEPQLFETFLERERVLTQTEIRAFADRWQLLKSQNAPLRVVENGVVVSADASYYDSRIRKAFPETSCKIADIIGRALFHQEILTGDVFIAKRIRHFIDNGELVVLEKSEKGFYHTVVSRP